MDDNPFISDQTTFDEVLTRLEDADGPIFLNVVTMQNRYPMAGKYDEPIPVTGLSDATATEQIEHYARGLRYSDDAIRHFIRALEMSDENTVVMFYGDHLSVSWLPPS